MSRVFDGSSTMASLVFSEYNLLPVINRFGIRLGFKDKTIEQVCEENGVETSFFLAIVNTYMNPNYLPHSGLIGFSPGLIVDYLHKTHDYYLNYSIPRIDYLLDGLVNSGQGEGMALIRKFYREYRHEFFAHISDEEENFFPYVRSIVSGKPNATYAARTFEQTHTNLDEKLSDLRNLIIKYLQPTYDDNRCNEFLIALHNLEDDLKDHARIEDLILAPIVEQVEKDLGL